MCLWACWTPWHGHGLGRHRNTSACLSLAPSLHTLPSSSAWLMLMAGPLHSHPVWFSEVCTSHMLGSIAVRRPALSSFLLRNCSPYLFSYCLITWLGAQSTMIKIANSLFFRLFRRGLKTSFKMRFACLITSTSGRGTSHNVPHGINGLSKFKPLLHYPWDWA